MSDIVSTICYGISLANNDLESRFAEWWFEDIHKYKQPFVLYNAEGEYVDGRGEQDFEAWYKPRKEFESLHNCKYKLETYGDEYGGYECILVLWSIDCFDDGLKLLDINKIPKFTKQDSDDLIDFCKTFNLEFDGEPNLYWFVSR